MNWLLALVVGVLAVELCIRLPLIEAARQVMRIAHKSFSVVSSTRISDHWKELVLLRYSRDIFINTMKLAGVFLVLAVFVVIVMFIADQLHPGLSDYLLTMEGLLLTTVLSLVYIWVRIKIV